MAELTDLLPNPPKILETVGADILQLAIKEAKQIDRFQELLILLGAASELEEAMAVYRKVHKRFCSLNDRLYCETGKDALNLRMLLFTLDSLTTVRVKLVN